jgi:hypothetical protein
MHSDKTLNAYSPAAVNDIEQRITGQQNPSHPWTSPYSGRDSIRHSFGHLNVGHGDLRGAELASVTKLRAALESVSAVPIEQAAELLDVSVRTLYRRRSEFEHKRLKGHLYFTLRGIKQYIEIEQYNPTTSFDITISDDFDISDEASSDNQVRRG